MKNSVYDYLKANHRTISQDPISIAKLIALMGWVDVTTDDIKRVLEQCNNE